MRNLSTKKHSGLGVKRGGVKTTNCVHHDSGYTLTTLTCNRPCLLQLSLSWGERTAQGTLSESSPADTVTTTTHTHRLANVQGLVHFLETQLLCATIIKQRVKQQSNNGCCNLLGAKILLGKLQY